MTLSRWFRDYVYIPLGGNRAGPVRTYFNLFAVFFLCGLWHGAAYTFIIWGMIHGLLLVAERIARNHLGLVPSGLAGWALTQLLVLIAWVFFRCDSLTAAVTHLQAMFGAGRAVERIYSVPFYLTPDKMFFLVAGVVISLYPARRAAQLFDIAVKQPSAWIRASAFACLIYAIACIAANGFNPFIYFRF